MMLTKQGIHTNDNIDNVDVSFPSGVASRP